MADSLHVELVSADRTVWSGESTMVIARTVDGDVGVLHGHQPMLSLLDDAVVEIVPVDAAGGEGNVVYATADGGFISVANDRVSILSEHILLAEEIDLEQAKVDLEKAESLIGIENDAEQLIRRAEARVRAVEKARSARTAS